MILTDTDIKSAIRSRQILISDFDEQRLGPNSYDLTLGEDIAWYEDAELDCKKKHDLIYSKIGEQGTLLVPGQLYLGVTREKTTTPHHVPMVEGKSSVGRLGITVHVTAGFGDIGFEGHWTLEITVVKPVRIYAGMPVAQVYFVLPLGACTRPYNRKKDSKYADQPALPMPSMMYKNFETSTL